MKQKSDADRVQCSPIYLYHQDETVLVAEAWLAEKLRIYSGPNGKVSSTAHRDNCLRIWLSLAGCIATGSHVLNQH
jgi:hypothetical protein